MDNFELKEHEGRTLTNEFLNATKATEVNYTEDKYDTVDLYFTYKGEKVVGEIKTRKRSYVKYGTHLIEVDKYMNLTKAKIDSNCYSGLYLNFFGNNVLYMYNIRDIDTTTFKFEWKYVPKTTAVNSGYELKHFIHIPVKYAQIFVREDGKWRKSNRTESFNYI